MKYKITDENDLLARIIATQLLNPEDSASYESEYETITRIKRAILEGISGLRLDTPFQEVHKVVLGLLNLQHSNH